MARKRTKVVKATCLAEEKDPQADTVDVGVDQTPTASDVAAQTVHDLRFYKERQDFLNRLKASVADDRNKPTTVLFSGEGGTRFSVDIGGHGLAMLRVTSERCVRELAVALLEWESLEAALHVERLEAQLKGMLRT